jgi:lipid-A-disaccharide synthase
VIFLSAGEASGDVYGAQILLGLRERVPGVMAFGLGGAEMERAGFERVVRAEDVAHMGITEVVRHMPFIYREYRRLVSSLRKARPDVAVLIDFPDVNFRLAKHLRRMGVPVVWFVSPQLWAWKRRRLRWVQDRVAKMLVIFPFEETFYRARGVDAEFVGHPLAALPVPEVSREAYAEAAAGIVQEQWMASDGIYRTAPLPGWAMDAEVRYELDPERPWIALLPGSRRSEIEANLPAMIRAAYLLPREYEFLVPVAPTITDRRLKEIQYGVGDRCLTAPDPPRITFVRDARAALFHARAAAVASGTATVQAALIGTPFAVVYRVSSLTFAVAKRLVRYPDEVGGTMDEHGNLPIGMVNLAAGRRIVPELLNERFTPEALAAALRPLLADGPEREEQVRALGTLRERLLPDAGRAPVERIVDAVMALLPGPAAA